MKSPLVPYPLELTTTRLRLCAPGLPHAGDIYRAAVESYPEVRRWLSWAKSRPTLAAIDHHNREALAKFVTGKEFHFRVYLKQRKVLVGTAGVITLDPAVPSFEIGYWCRTRFSGQGYTSEAVEALVEFARRRLRARRVQIRTDARNEKSWRIPERLGFTLEGTLKQFARDNRGRLINMRIYARTF